ncbi:MAG: hypothetical protein V1734_05680 [Nanoarchaeota archaeon]
MAKAYENYPFTINLVCNILSLAIYGIGAYLLALISIYIMFFYLLFVLLSEYRLLKHSCRHCYYYGKRCAFGKGKVCSILFSKGNAKTFTSRKITRKSLIPDFLVFLVPFVAGIALLIMHFSGVVLVLVVILFLLGSMGNAFVRSNLACKYCKQRGIGCPAEKLFKKKN